MNRREMFKLVVGAVVTGDLLPGSSKGGPALNNPLNLWCIDEDDRIKVNTEWSIADQAFIVCARCYDPPVQCHDMLTKSEIVKHNMDTDMVFRVLGVMQKGCVGSMKHFLDTRVARAEAFVARLEKGMLLRFPDLADADHKLDGIPWPH